MNRAPHPILLLAASAVLLLGTGAPAGAGEPWYITGPVAVRQPMEVGEVVVLDGGELLVEDVEEPGFRLGGNLWVLGTGRVVLRRSVVRVQSTYHGQFTVVAFNGGSVEVEECDYRVPSGVQHALAAYGGTVTLRDSDFGFVQLAAAEGGRVTGERLDGDFEVVLPGASTVALRDVPRNEGQGSLWVWPTFSRGSRAVYTPPPPGFVERWEFPPEDATGVLQDVLLERCQARLWPLLVETGAHLTLRDVPEDNWVIVGMVLSSGATEVDGLVGGGPPVDLTMELGEGTLRLEGASVDTWNLYALGHAHVRVTDSVLGEILVLEGGSLVVDRSVVDGSGGYLGVKENGYAVVRDSTLTCDVQASDDATLELHGCKLLPYPWDPEAAFTRLGAHGEARILLDATVVETNPALDAAGLLAVTWISDPPPHPPAPGARVDLHGMAALYSLDPGVAAGRWRLEVLPRWGRTPVLLASGEGNVDPPGFLGSWSGADPHRDHELRLVLTDGLGRILSGSVRVPGVPRSPPAVRRPRGASGR